MKAREAVELARAIGRQQGEAAAAAWLATLAAAVAETERAEKALERKAALGKAFSPQVRALAAMIDGAAAANIPATVKAAPASPSTITAPAIKESGTQREIAKALGVRKPPPLTPKQVELMRVQPTPEQAEHSYHKLLRRNHASRLQTRADAAAAEATQLAAERKRAAEEAARKKPKGR